MSLLTLRPSIPPKPVTAPAPAFRPGGPEIAAERRRAPGAILLYHYPTRLRFKNASTILEHVDSFSRYSRFQVWNVNTDEPLPEGIASLDFEAILLHYSLFAPGLYAMTESHAEWVRSSSAYKVAFFQDENRFCRQRFGFIDEFGVDAVFTCLEPSQFDAVYGSHTDASVLRSNIPGYVGEELLAAAERLSLPDAERPVDVGYRGRPIPPYSGRGGLEKVEIGSRFRELAIGSGLRLDIETGEADRLYGDDWYRFIAGCRAVLGVESGTSVFDVDDEVVAEYERLVAAGDGEVTVDDLEPVMAPLEDKIHYRTISPRHFEAAAFRVCQILFEGSYSGLMEPMVHYIPLRKDFSNIDQVLDRFRDAELRRELAENAHRDLIASDRSSYRTFVREVDEVLAGAGLGVAAASEQQGQEIATALRHGRLRRRMGAMLSSSLLAAVQWAYLITIKIPGGRALMRALGRLRRDASVEDA